MTASARTRRDVRTPLILGAILGAGTLLVAVRDPNHGGYPVCPVLVLTGFACAGCGGLRAAHDLATGDLAAAWSMNPLLTIAMPVAALLWLLWLVRSATDRQPWHPPAWIWIVVGVLVLTFSVLRNVPALHPLLGPA